LSAVPEFRAFEFYLAGGTALNFYLGHRRSVDEDFFTQKKFEPIELLAALRAHFNVTQYEISKNTLHCFIDGLKCSFFYYPYPLLDAPKAHPFPVASLVDIAAMKLSAILSRGAKKDFYDLYIILNRHLDFAKAWEAYKRKFSASQEDLYPILKSLSYFDDAETETLGIEDEQRIWHEVKAYFKNLSKQLLSLEV